MSAYVWLPAAFIVWILIGFAMTRQHFNAAIIWPVVLWLRSRK